MKLCEDIVAGNIGPAKRADRVHIGIQNKSHRVDQSPIKVEHHFDGQLGHLDYAFASASLASEVTGIGNWHINADEVPLFDNNDGVKDAGEATFEERPDGSALVPPRVMFQPASPYRASDHDPVIVGLFTIADVSVSKVDTPDPALAGTNLSYTITARNAGPDSAASVSLSDTLPAGMTFVSLASPGGWSCTTPAVGAGGTVSCSIANMPVGSAIFTLNVQVHANVANGTVLSNTATASGATSDPTPGNNSATATTTVIDTVAPTVTDVSSTAADGCYTTGAVIPVTVTFSDVVHVTGTPQLTLETGATDAVVNYTSGSGTATLTFNYTVQAGNNALDLEYISTAALALNGGTIKDAAANDAVLTLPTPGAAGSLGANKALVIDTLAPDTLIDSNPASPTNNPSATFPFHGDDGSGVGVAGFECELDGGGFSACTSPQSYAGLADGSHTFQVRAKDSIGNTDASPASFTWTVDTAVATRYTVFLPFVDRAGAPDLVVSVSISPNKPQFSAGEPVTIQVTVTNSGNAAANPFWVDLYLNPSSPPTAANQIWNTRCKLTPCFGMAWYVASGLAPGQSMTLSSQSPAPGYSVWPGWFAAGTTDLYVYADSYNPGVAAGAVAELDESNNRAELHGLNVNGVNLLQVQLDRLDQRPLRPAQTARQHGENRHMVYHRAL